VQTYMATTRVRVEI